MESLIPTINKLQEIFYQVNMPFEVQLPQIVVVGAQSTGKSSVLESIVGHDFLPRGTGIVTRTPVCLQLCRTKAGSSRNGKGSPDVKAQDYAIFPEKPDKVFTKFSEVREEIENQTKIKAGEKQDVVDDPIIIKIYSPNVLDLTLVDLPGLTRVPVGSQTEETVKLIRKLVLKYASNPNSIILSMSAANVDLANSDALNLAREVDPKGDRTIGVFTKFDLLDPTTAPSSILAGKEYHLRNGYYAIICRNQEDNKKGLSMAAALDKERNIFKLEKYASVRDRCGVGNLSKTLNGILISHIQNCVPELKRNLEKLLNERKTEARAYGDSPFDGKDSESARHHMFDLLEDYKGYYGGLIEGNPAINMTKEYHLGARIQHIFQEIYAKELNYLSPFDDLTDDDIRTAIQNAKALKPSLFIPEAAFECLIRLQIRKLLTPSLNCALQVHNELRNRLMHPEIKKLDRFPRLRSRFTELSTDLLSQCLEPTEKMIRNLIDIETAYINVNHPDVLTGISAILEMFRNYEKTGKREEVKEIKKVGQVSSKPSGNSVYPSIAPQIEFQIYDDQKNNDDKNKNDGEGGPILDSIPEVIRPEGDMSSREALEVEMTKQLMLSYFRVVVVRVADMVPKLITSNLIKKSLQELNSKILTQIEKEKNIETLMEEDSSISERRASCKKMISTLEDSLQVLEKLRSQIL